MEGSTKIEAFSESGELQDEKCKASANVNTNSGVGDKIRPVDGSRRDAASSSKSPTTRKVVVFNKDDCTEYTEGEWEAIAELRGLYLSTLEIDIVLQDESFELEKSMQPQFKAIYEERAKVLANIRQQDSSSLLAKFWLVVLKIAFPDLITTKDEPILAHLIDLRSTIYLEPENKFTIEFVFEPNDYFTNEVLTKTYYLQTMPDTHDPFEYTGTEVNSCAGCTIDWKDNYMQTISEWCGFSFFDFFDPPAIPSDPNDIDYGHIRRILEKDYECGYYLKSCVIPKAVLFFIGKIRSEFISDCESDDASSDSSASSASGGSNDTLCDYDDEDNENAKDCGKKETPEADENGELDQSCNYDLVNCDDNDDDDDASD